MASTMPGPMGVRQRGTFTRKVSTHLAYALVVSTLIQIAIVSSISHNWLLHLGIIVVVGMMIPASRNMERRWEMLDESGLSYRGLETRYRTDVLHIWALALIVLPAAWLPLTILY